MGTVSQIWLSLESNKNEHSRGWRWSCKCSCPQVNVLFSFLKIKNILLFKELLFYYPELPFYLRFLISFQSISLVFQKNLLFIYCKCFFFQECFFSAFCIFSLFCSELLREMIFSLLLFRFLLELFVDQIIMPYWYPLKPLHKVFLYLLFKF